MPAIRAAAIDWKGLGHSSTVSARIPADGFDLCLRITARNWRCITVRAFGVSLVEGKSLCSAGIHPVKAGHDRFRPAWHLNTFAVRRQPLLSAGLYLPSLVSAALMGAWSGTAAADRQCGRPAGNERSETQYRRPAGSVLDGQLADTALPLPHRFALSTRLPRSLRPASVGLAYKHFCQGQKANPGPHRLVTIQGPGRSDWAFLEMSQWS